MERRARGYLQMGDRTAYQISKFEGAFARVLERNDGTVPDFIRGYTAADTVNGHHGQFQTTGREFKIRFTPDFEESQKWHEAIRNGSTNVDVIVVYIDEKDSMDKVVMNVVNHLKTAHDAHEYLSNIPD